MCWLTPKSLEGSSEKLEIDKSGLWSQSESGRRVEEDVEKEDRLLEIWRSNREVEAL
jgi:hypothetical protein